MESIFSFVYLALKQMAQITGFSYREINIIVYFFIIPMIYFVMIDKMMQRHILKISLTTVFLLVFIFFDFYKFSNQLFEIAVVFLQSFKVVGIDYVVSSVIFCVVIPGVIFVVLFYYAYIRRRQIEKN